MPHQKLIRVLNYVWLLVVFPVAVAILVGVFGHSANLTTGENSLPQARSGQIRVIFYAKGRPLWRDGAGGRTGFLELFSR